MAKKGSSMFLKGLMELCEVHSSKTLRGNNARKMNVRYVELAERRKEEEAELGGRRGFGDLWSRWQKKKFGFQMQHERNLYSMGKKNETVVLIETDSFGASDPR